VGAHASYITGIDLAHVLFVGGGPGSGKSSISRALACRWDLQLYNVDHRTYDHAGRLGGHTPDWSRTPEELVADFVEYSHARWPLVLEDLAALPDSPAAIVEGPFVLPELVPVGAQAVFLLPPEEQIRRVRAERGTRPVVTERDVLLAARIADAAEHVVVVDRPLDEMIERVADVFSLEGLPRAVDRPAIRRFENDVLARQVRLFRASGDAPPGDDRPVPFACECDVPGCADLVEVTLADYDALSGAGGRSPLRAPRS
jgi:hypothetical protein